MNVYVVKRKSPDVSVRMVEIMGIHKTEAEAKSAAIAAAKGNL
jgi:hypothetical protein